LWVRVPAVGLTMKRIFFFLGILLFEKWHKGKPFAIKKSLVT